MRCRKAVKYVFTMNSTTESTRPKDWKTKREIAAHFKCSVRTITSLMRRRILPYVKNGRLLRFDTVDCDRAMEAFRSESMFDSPTITAALPGSQLQTRAISEPHRWVEN